MQRVDEIIEKKLAFLRDNNVDTSIFELKVLMAEVLGIEVGSLRFYDEELSDDQYEKFLSYVEMRKNFMLFGVQTAEGLLKRELKLKTILKMK